VTTAVRMLHASDVHIDDTSGGDRGLVQLVDAAIELAVDLVVLVGDTFDDNRVKGDTTASFAAHLDRLRVPVVVLPGNHDPLMDGSVYHRTELPAHVTVLRDPEGTSVVLPALGIELDGLPPRGEQPWQVALAHGHLVRYPEDEHRSYLIRSDEIAACDRDYLALGHWDVQHDVSAGGVTAWYSGSPRRYATCALVTFSAAPRSVHVEPVRLPG
jgi:DNA repair exonuclease SbcCD nuclease subunit